MTQKELDEIVERHQHWLKRDCDGWENMKANLSYADLSYTNLMGVNLRGAYLYYANLTGVNLKNADLTCANLYMANLSEANLIGVNLTESTLACSNLMLVNLMGSNLTGACLYNAVLINTNLRNANLYKADMRKAVLHDVNLIGTKNIPTIPMTCPECGSFTGFKKAGGCIVELEIPADARRLSATTRKCRCNRAKVINIYDFKHNKVDINEVCSDRDKNFIYRIGETVAVDDFDEDRWNECSTGIHFFINFQEAVDY